MNEQKYRECFTSDRIKGTFSARCKYISIYSLHLALTPEDLFSTICVFQNKAVPLNRSFRQTTNSQKVTEKRYSCNLSCTP